MISEAEARRFVSAYENHKLSPEGEKSMRFARAIVERSASEAPDMEAVEAAKRVIAGAEGSEDGLSLNDAEFVARALLSRASPSSEAARREAIEECAAIVSRACDALSDCSAPFIAREIDNLIRSLK